MSERAAFLAAAFFIGEGVRDGAFPFLLGEGEKEEEEEEEAAGVGANGLEEEEEEEEGGGARSPNAQGSLAGMRSTGRVSLVGRCSLGAWICVGGWVGG